MNTDEPATPKRSLPHKINPQEPGTAKRPLPQITKNISNRRFSADVSQILRKRDLESKDDGERTPQKNNNNNNTSRLLGTRRSSASDVLKGVRSGITSLDETPSPSSAIATSVPVSIDNDHSFRTTPREETGYDLPSNDPTEFDGHESAAAVSAPVSRGDTNEGTENAKGAGANNDEEKDHESHDHEREDNPEMDGLDGSKFVEACRFDDHTHEEHCVACRLKPKEQWVKKHSYLKKGDGKLLRQQNLADVQDDSEIVGDDSALDPNNQISQGEEPLHAIDDVNPGQRLDSEAEDLSREGGKLGDDLNDWTTYESGLQQNFDAENSASGGRDGRENLTDDMTNPTEFADAQDGEFLPEEGNFDDEENSEYEYYWEDVPEGEARQTVTALDESSTSAGVMEESKWEKERGENEEEGSHKNETDSSRLDSSGREGLSSRKADLDHNLEESYVGRSRSRSPSSKSMPNLAERQPPYPYSTPPVGFRNFIGGGSSYPSHLQTSISTIARARSQETLNIVRPYRRSQATVLPTSCSICESCERADLLSCSHPHVDVVPRHDEDLRSVKQRLEQQEAGLMNSIDSLRRCLGDAEKNAVLARDAIMEEHARVIEAAADFQTDTKSPRLHSKGGLRAGGGPKRQAQMQAAVADKKRESEAIENELRMELMRSQERLRAAQQEIAPFKETADWTQFVKGKEGENSGFSNELEGPQEQESFNYKEGTYMCEPAQIVQVSFGDKAESDCESLRRDLAHTQQHLHLIHQQLDLLRDQSGKKLKEVSHDISSRGSGFQSTLEDAQEQLLSLEQSHSRRETELHSKLENLQARESDLKLEMKQIQEELQIEMASGLEKLQKAEEEGILFQEEKDLLRLESGHEEAEAHKDLGSVQLEVFEGHTQFKQLKEEMESNAEKERDYLGQLESQLSKSKEDFSQFRRKSISELQLTEDQLGKAQQQAADLARLRRRSLHDLADTQQQLRQVQQQAEELSALDQHHRKSLISKDRSEAELKNQLEETEGQLEEVQDRLLKLEEQCGFLEEQNNALRLEGVHSEFEVQVDLGLTQVQLQDAQKQYEYLKSEMQANAEKEKKLLRALEDELLHTIRKKDEELSHMDRNLRRSISVREQTEAELQNELRDSQAHLEEVLKTLQESQTKSADLEDTIKIIAEREAEVHKELESTQAQLQDSQDQNAHLKDQMNANAEKEKLYIQELDRQLSSSQEQAKESSQLRRASELNLEDAREKLTAAEQERILFTQLKEEMEANSEKERQYLKGLETKLSDSTEEFSRFRRKSLKDLEDTQQQLQAAQDKAKEFSQFKRKSLQDLNEAREKLRATQADHMDNSKWFSMRLKNVQKERDEYGSGKKMLVVQLEQLQSEKIQLQLQLQEMLQELSNLRATNEEKDHQLAIDNGKDVAVSVLDFVESVSHMLGELHKIFDEHQEQQQQMREEITVYMNAIAAVRDTKDVACETMGTRSPRSLAGSAECQNCSKDELEDAVSAALRTYGVDPSGRGISDDQYNKIKWERIQRQTNLSNDGHANRRDVRKSADEF